MHCQRNVRLDAVTEDRSRTLQISCSQQSDVRGIERRRATCSFARKDALGTARLYFAARRASSVAPATP